MHWTKLFWNGSKEEEEDKIKKTTTSRQHRLHIVNGIHQSCPFEMIVESVSQH